MRATTTTHNGAAETPYDGAADPWSDGPAGRKARFLDAVAFEWIKVSTVRSTWWTLFAAAFITISIGAFAGSGADAGSEVDFVLREIYVGLPIGQLAICLFGALAATSEYGTGSIRSTFTAVPKRPRLLAAKALVVFAVSLVTGLLTSFATYTAGTLSLGAAVARPELSDGAVLRAVLGGGCYLGVLGVFALLVGLLLRASAGAITACVGLTFILPLMFHALSSLGDLLLKWWPTEAGQQVLHTVPTDTRLAPLAGLGWFAVCTLLALALVTSRVTRRDA
ncbi:ABC transporter permease [Streptomyces platensis]|uniref:ABC transporter permease n=1 Tax=Streptomyces platensis TaxID=58346 RepID=UPI00386CE0E0|nr:ABC transporter permease [Streptomyces platensis]